MAEKGMAGPQTRPQPAGDATLEDKVAALRQPGAYPHQVAAIEAIETHFAWVFLTGELAYKLKKPLMLKGADLRTLGARQRNCREELRVNHRLSPDVYLRVAPLASTDGSLAVDAGGGVEDWLVVMRELPRERMLDRLLHGGDVGRSDVERIIARLVEFYRGLPAETRDPRGYLDRVQARLAEALDELARPEFGLPADAVSGARASLEAACARYAPALAERASAGRVVEVHGDLRAEHVWVGPRVEFIDALEFDRTLRVLDMAEEVAMLCLDVIRLGAPDVSGLLRDTYRRAMPDPLDDGLFAFYGSLRAMTRAKVSIWHLDDAGQYPDPAPWQARARLYIELARSFVGDS